MPSFAKFCWMPSMPAQCWEVDAGENVKRWQHVLCSNLVPYQIGSLRSTHGVVGRYYWPQRRTPPCKPSVRPASGNAWPCPGSRLPNWLQAAKVVLEQRVTGATGWSMGRKLKPMGTSARRRPARVALRQLTEKTEQYEPTYRDTHPPPGNWWKLWARHEHYRNVAAEPQPVHSVSLTSRCWKTIANRVNNAKVIWSLTTGKPSSPEKPSI